MLTLHSQSTDTDRKYTAAYKSIERILCLGGVQDTLAKSFHQKRKLERNCYSLYVCVGSPWRNRLQEHKKTKKSPLFEFGKSFFVIV